MLFKTLVVDPVLLTRVADGGGISERALKPPWLWLQGRELHALFPEQGKRGRRKIGTAAHCAGLRWGERAFPGAEAQHLPCC